MAINLTSGTLQTINTDGVDQLLIPANYKFPSWPAFHAYRDAGHVSPGSTQVIFNGTQLNNGGHYNTSTGYFTAPMSGNYWFHVWTMDTNSARYVNDWYRIQVNNSSTNELRVYTSNNVSARSHRSGGWIRRLNTGDTVRVLNYNANIYGTSRVYCYFVGCLLST